MVKQAWSHLSKRLPWWGLNAQRRYLDLTHEVEWWGLYEPSVIIQVYLYLLVAIPVAAEERTWQRLYRWSRWRGRRWLSRFGS